MASSKYYSPPQQPPVFTATPESILADAKKIIEQNKKVLDQIVAEVTPETATFDNVLHPILVNENESTESRHLLGFYHYVSADAALREASNKAEAMMDEYKIESRMRDDVFKLVDAAFNTRAKQSLDQEPLHILEKERRKYINSGLLLPQGPERERYMEIGKRLSQLSIEANKNLNEQNSGIWFTPEQLEGVTKDEIDLDQLEKGTGENAGKVKLGFKYDHLIPLPKYAKHEQTRREYIVADANKNDANVPLFQEIIELRDEAARLLGYKHHSSARIAEKMARTSDYVEKFLSDLRSRVKEGAKREIQHLLEYKKRDCEERNAPFDGNIYMWDTAYYSRIMKEKEFSVDEGAVSQYFPVEPTFSGMLKIFEEIFGFVFIEIKGEDRDKLSPTGKGADLVWHEDVLIYSVWNDESMGNDFVGYLYLDLHPRDNKYGHNANFNIDRGYLKADGKRHYPATALVCNFSKPTPTKPALLKPAEVVTLFHELGHGIHDLATKARYSHFHGTAVVDDFVEAPSQMLENWCWTPSVLKSLSQHWNSKEQIPDDLLEKLMKTKHINTSMFILGQLVIGMFDMTVHSPESHEAAKAMNCGRIWNRLRGEITGIKGPEDVGLGLQWGNRHAGIGHFIGGYDAGYYGYLFSEVFSLDMFHSFFQKDPMDKKEGRRYRQTILERGGSIDEMEILKEFLGREPNSEAFYKELGLS